jgi:signal transduction histidine kinase
LAVLYAACFLLSGVVLLALANIGARAQVSTAHADKQIFVSPVPPAFPARPEIKVPARLDIHPEQEDRLHAIAVASALSLVVMAVLSGALGWAVAGRVLRPLRTMTDTARHISASNLHERLDLRHADGELGQLGATLDDLFGRLEASFESQRHFVANASHELRTPLAAERAVLQVALGDPDADVESLRTTCEEVLALGTQQERLIDALLTLATSERGVERWEPIDLGEVVARVIDQRATDAEARGVELVARTRPSPTTGDPSLVESLVANLVDNGLRHNHVGGRVEVATSTADGRSTVAVWNTGPVVAASDVDRLFQPFQRAGAERLGGEDGHGLGLAIVAAIAEAHGAAVTARPRPAGGLDVDVAFPVDRA